MRTNRVQNGSLENAKQTVGNLRRLPITTPETPRKNRATQCPTTGRAAIRKKLAVIEEAVTTVAVKVDIGFGNTLFIRGEGEGLSWNVGQPLDCIDGSTWVWSRRPATEPVTFKLLINDQLWCRGENLHAAPGAQAQFVPSF